jgi:hypothetical protein
VSHDSVAQQEMARIGARGVPTFKLGDEVIIGFDRERLLKISSTQIIECPNCRTKLRIPRNKGTLKITCHHCENQFKVKS